MKTISLLSICLCTTLAACASSEASIDGDPPGGSHNVSQGGAQDIAQFRALVQQGQVPSPETLDSVGFFAEHAIDLPAADCGKDVCVHSFLAVAPRFGTGNWTMAFVAMNTAVDPKDLPHPPVHLAIVVEHSAYAGLDVQSMKAGMEALLAGLKAEDRVSVISYGETAERLSLTADPKAPSLIDDLLKAGVWDSSQTKVALYDGIAEADKAFQDADAAGFSGQHRVLLLTSGHATAGITDPAHIVGLGEGLVRQGTAFGVIGVGPKFEQDIPLTLGSMGAGTYSYALNKVDLNGLLKNEGQTSLYPLATDLTLNLIPAKGYKVGRIYGIHRATSDASGATLRMPALFIGQRDGSADVGGSRRGGGGGLFVELLSDPEQAGNVGANAPAFQVTADWTKPEGSVPQSLETTLLNTLPPGENPPDMWWNISDNGSGKQYMMLNMYLGLRGSLDFYQAGDCDRSLGVIDMMKTSVGAWLGKYQDTDIDDDNNLMLQLRGNIEMSCQASQTTVDPTPPQNFNGGCCFL